MYDDGTGGHDAPHDPAPALIGESDGRWRDTECGRYVSCVMWAADQQEARVDLRVGGFSCHRCPNADYTPPEGEPPGPERSSYDPAIHDECPTPGCGAYKWRSSKRCAACHAIHLRVTRKQHLVEVPCGHCGEPVERRPSRLARYGAAYCDRRCRGRATGFGSATE